MAESKIDTGHYDCVIVGAGFAGLYAIKRLRELGLSLCCFEASEDVGGVWNFNAYPGAQCDVPSRDYCYSFSQELLESWRWSKKFAGQPEIHAYARHVADRCDLRRSIRFGARVSSAAYDEDRARWVVQTERGDRVTARFCVVACGHLSTPNHPSLEGLGSFAGQWYHSGQWPREPVDLRGKRIGVIGTGSTGIQLVVSLSKSAGQLYVFQRTPQYSLPIANGPTDPDVERAFYKDYAAYRKRVNESFSTAYYQDVEPRESAIEADPAEREAVFEWHWRHGTGSAVLRSYRDIMTSEAANALLADFVRRKIRAIVKSPEVAEKLLPRYPIGAKRIAMDEGYFQSFNLPNVHLVDLREAAIERITPAGILTARAEYPLDVLIFATGYDAFTGTLFKMNITGRGGVPLAEKWKAGPLNYLGLMTAGFPNLFIIQGPGSTSVLVNVLVGISHQVDWIAECLAHLRREGLATIEAEEQAERSWVEYCNTLVEKTVFLKADSWWLGANVPGKPRVFMPFVGGFKLYRDRCDGVARDGYRGFRFGPGAAHGSGPTSRFRAES